MSFQKSFKTVHRSAFTDIEWKIVPQFWRSNAEVGVGDGGTDEKTGGGDGGGRVEDRMLRFSLGVTIMDKIRNECIRGTAQVGRFGEKT